MGYSTVDTQWPAALISEEVRALIDLLFSTLDDSSENAGPRLADEIFAHDGMLTATAGTASGYAGKRQQQDTDLIQNIYFGNMTKRLRVPENMHGA